MEFPISTIELSAKFESRQYFARNRIAFDVRSIELGTESHRVESITIVYRMAFEQRPGAFVSLLRQVEIG